MEIATVVQEGKGYRVMIGTYWAGSFGGYYKDEAFAMAKMINESLRPLVVPREVVHKLYEAFKQEHVTWNGYPEEGCEDCKIIAAYESYIQGQDAGREGKQNG